jgi:NAD+-dependent farnesol dehydrogenase
MRDARLNMRVLVTGGTGYLGRAIVQALARQGHRPVIFSRRAATVARSERLPGEAIDGDVRDRNAVLNAARGADGICHAAGLVSMWQRDAADFDRVNVGGLETVADVCRTLSIPRLVYTSSFLALPPAGHSRAMEANDYQRSKVRAREIARGAAMRGIPIVSLVPGVVYGPGPDTDGNLVGRLLRDHLARRLPGLVGANHLWSFAYVDDVADAHVAALERGDVGEEYVLGGENVPQIRMFELLHDTKGTPLPRRISHMAAVAGAWWEERSAGKRPPRLTRGTVKILHHDWPLDSARSVDKLSYRMTALSTGLSRVINGPE